MYEKLLDGLKHSNTAYNWINRQNQEAAEAIESLQATNKTLLDALKAIEFATKPEPDDGSFHENAYTLAQQAIADAELSEGKEG